MNTMSIFESFKPFEWLRTYEAFVGVIDIS